MALSTVTVAILITGIALFIAILVIFVTWVMWDRGHWKCGQNGKPQTDGEQGANRVSMAGLNTVTWHTREPAEDDYDHIAQGDESSGEVSGKSGNKRTASVILGSTDRANRRNRRRGGTGKAGEEVVGNGSATDNGVYSLAKSFGKANADDGGERAIGAINESDETKGTEQGSGGGNFYFELGPSDFANQTDQIATFTSNSTAKSDDYFILEQANDLQGCNDKQKNDDPNSVSRGDYFVLETETVPDTSAEVSNADDNAGSDYFELEKESERGDPKMEAGEEVGKTDGHSYFAFDKETGAVIEKDFGPVESESRHGDPTYYSTFGSGQ